MVTAFIQAIQKPQEQELKQEKSMKVMRYVKKCYANNNGMFFKED